MKLKYGFVRKVDPDVAPHAGAWIETAVSPAFVKTAVVAPHAGAWIETLG